MATLDDIGVNGLLRLVIAERLGLPADKVTDVIGNADPSGEWVEFSGKVKVPTGFITECLLEAARRADPNLDEPIRDLTIQLGRGCTA